MRIWAPSTSASVIIITLSYRACEISKVAPDPAPTTWMMAEHSLLASICETEAFWTLSIFPRIGSSAWNIELRAALAVPSAESPSTINSSAISSLPGWQSESFAGMDADSRAFFRRVTSLVFRACTRACISPTIFSSTRLDWSLKPRFDPVIISPNCLSHILVTIGLTWAVPRTSLVCPWN